MHNTTYMCGLPTNCQCNCEVVEQLVLFIIATECLVGCGGIQHRLLPTSPSRHPKGCVRNHGLVLVSCELGSLSMNVSTGECIQT